MASLRLSVIMPSFNEEGSIEEAVREVQQAVFATVPDAELIVIDSSKDRTPEILKTLAAADPRIRVILQPPIGHGPALRTGLDSARGEFVFLIDSDRQIPLEAFPPLWERVQTLDAAMGMRVRRHDPWLRLRLTWLVRRCIGLLFQVPIYDANVPFKIVRKSVWQEAAPLIPPDVLAPSLFLSIFLQAGGFKVYRTETPHAERQTGVVSIRRWKLFKVCVRGFREMLTFRSRLKEWRSCARLGEDPFMAQTVSHRPRLTVFAVALALRLLCGAAAFGSVDLVNSLTSTRNILAGGQWLDVPYFPTMAVFLWLGGALALKTPWPLALGYKLFPILCDSLLAVLVYDILRHRLPDRAFAAGLLYACSPVAILITCFHAQWDPIWMFFLVLAFHVRDDEAEGRRKNYLFGGLFAASLLFKPVALIAAPFFLSPRFWRPTGKYQRDYEFASIAGAAAVFGAAILVMTATGYSVLERFFKIGDYSAGRVQLFGLPMAFPFDQIRALRSRVWLLGPVILLLVPYAKGRLNGFEALLAVFCLSLGLTGLCPQYLLWPVPFLLVTCRFGMAALYQAVVTAFLMLYYLNPQSTLVANENMATFALLRPLASLLPPASWTTTATRPVVYALGNYVVPLTALGVVAVLLLCSRRPVAEPSALENQEVWYLWAIGAGTALVVAMRVMLASPDLAPAFTDVFVDQRVREYAVTEQGKFDILVELPSETAYKQAMVVGDYPDGGPIHLGWLLPTGAVLWSMAALRLGRVRRPVQPLAANHPPSPRYSGERGGGEG